MQLTESARYRVQADDGAGLSTVVFLRGEVDFGHARRLRELLLGVAESAGPLVVDMADTTFIDGAVLGVLAEVHAARAGGLAVRGAIGIVARAFRLVGLEHLFLS